VSLSSKIAVNSVAQASRQLVVAVTGIVSVGIATRYLSIEEYGGVLAALVLLSLFSVAADFGIAAMTVRAMAREPENALAIQSSAFWVWVAYGIPTAALIVLAAQLSYPGAEHETTRHAVLILLLTFPLGPFGGVANTRAIAEQRVWLTSLGSVAARTLSLGSVVLAVVLDLGPMGIAAAFASGFIFENLASIVLIRPKIDLRLGLDRVRIRSLVVAAIPLGAVMVINGLYFRLDAFLLSLLGGERDLALYGVAYKAFDTLLALPGFVMITLLPVLAQLDPGSERFQELVQKAFAGMCVIVVPLAGFSLLGREAMVTLAGPQYAEGGLVLTLVVLSVAFACLQGVFGNTLVTQGRQVVLLRVSLAVLVVNLVLNAIAIPLAGARGAAGGLLASEAVSIALTLYVYRTVAPLPRVMAPLRLLLALLALIAASSVRLLIDDEMIGMLVAVILGSVAYVAVLVALRALPPYVVAPFLSALRALRTRSAA
jgi:O-antigen/teichoic acid export membrane protein